MNSRRVLGVSGGVLALDQAAKWVIGQVLPLGAQREVIPGFFQLVHVRNPGAAFSLLAGMDEGYRAAFFVGYTLLAVAVLGWFLVKVREGWSRLSLALVLGGALGNLVDRVRYGAVVDFLDFYWGALHWPAFNVADRAIVVGVGILLWELLFRKSGV
ncbi:MAG: signal peptidase II [Nitrospirae bacterium]|nr:signal peptidase II [Nitrospirota bacterium]